MRILKKMQKNFSYRHLIRLLFVSLLFPMPLLVRWKMYLPSRDLARIFPLFNGFVVDLVLYYKSLFFNLISMLLFFFFIGERIYPDERVEIGLRDYRDNKKYTLLSILLIALILLSFVFSKYKVPSYMGAPNSYEGTLSWIGYQILFILGLNYLTEDFYLEGLKTGLKLILAAFAVYGLIEFLWRNPMDMKFLKFLILPREILELSDHLIISEFMDRITLTLFNPNYVGQFYVLVLPFYLGFTYLDNKTALIKERLFSGLVLVMSLLVLFLSGSTTAIYALMITLILQLILYRGFEIRKQVLVLLLLSFMMMALTSSLQKTPVLDYLRGNLAGTAEVERTLPFLESIELDEKGVEIRGENNFLDLHYDEDNRLLLARDKKSLDFVDDSYRIEEGDFSGVIIENYGEYFIVNFAEGVPLYFTRDDGSYFVINPDGTLTSRSANGIGFGLNERLLSMATGRGYIWDITLPQLKKTILLGNGADTSAFYIPQEDYAGKINYQYSPYVLIDKPHNMYLQVALNTGLISLVVLLLIIANYLATSFRIFITSKNYSINKQEYILGISLFAGITGFLITAFFYDSSISVSPIFWLFLALAICNNNSIKQRFI